jgi:hypothetical protein
VGDVVVGKGPCPDVNVAAKPGRGVVVRGRELRGRVWESLIKIGGRRMPGAAGWDPAR